MSHKNIHNPILFGILLGLLISFSPAIITRFQEFFSSCVEYFTSLLTS